MEEVFEQDAYTTPGPLLMAVHTRSKTATWPRNVRTQIPQDRHRRRVLMR